jgi:hypothetical protein
VVRTDPALAVRRWAILWVKEEYVPPKPTRCHLTAEELLLLINIFLRDVASRNQRVNAGLGHLVSVLAETNVEKLAADSILVAELVILPRARGSTLRARCLAFSLARAQL